jgi:hypothetical protein
VSAFAQAQQSTANQAGVRGSVRLLTLSLRATAPSRAFPGGKSGMIAFATVTCSELTLERRCTSAGSQYWSRISLKYGSGSQHRCARFPIYLTGIQTRAAQQWLEEDARLAQTSCAQARRHAPRLRLRTKVSPFGRAPSQLFCLSREMRIGTP